MKKRLLSALALCMITAASCFAQGGVSGTYTYDTECLGVEQDGSQTVKAWGFGGSRADAIEQAKKNAVRDVLFNGLRNGKNECNVKPLVFDMNAQEKHEDYFNKFFADGGEYLKYVNQRDEPIKRKLNRDKMKSHEGVEYGIVARVLRPQLRKKMILDNIITQ